MIIGINGKINSGKDTVGKIVQYLIDKKLAKEDLNLPDRDYWLNVSFKEYLTYKTRFNTWQIKKFADKLKDIVCLLLGCTREQLEDREFKEKELGEEWTRTFNSDYELIENRLFNPEIGDFQETLTVRKLLQEVGTEAMRNVVHPSIWVNALMSEYNSSKVFFEHSDSLGNTWKVKPHPIFEPNMFPNWIITDMRFPNEMKAVKDRNGITIRVNRSYEGNNIVKKTDNGDGTITLSPADPNWGKIILNPHPSETALDDATFDYIINNDGTIEELIEQVRKILVKEKIII